MLQNRKKQKKGITLYLTILILGLLFAIGIGLSLIVFTQIKMTREIGYSVNALCAADSGVERALYGLYQEGWPLGTSTSGSFDNASYTVFIYASSSLNCATGTQYYCIKSQGKFKDIFRNVEAAY